MIFAWLEKLRAHTLFTVLLFAERRGESDTCSTGNTTIILPEIESTRGVEAPDGKSPINDLLGMLSV